MTLRACVRARRRQLLVAASNEGGGGTLVREIDPFAQVLSRVAAAVRPPQRRAEVDHRAGIFE